MDTIRSRLRRLEAGAVQHRTIYDYSDEELIEIVGLYDKWPYLSENERERALRAIERLPL